MAGGVIKKSGSAGHRRRRRGAAASMSEINVTPFVDVMLVLLIIFMVAAPLMRPGVDVQLPKTAASALPTEQEEPLTITLTSDGLLMVMNTEVSEADFIPMLQGVAAERTSDRVYLRADGALPYERVAQVMGALNRAGFTNIAFVTDGNGPDFGAGN
jgi:biopolymer transport protein TolR